MKNQPLQKLYDPGADKELKIDYKRVFINLVRNWYWVFLSLLICLGIAYVKNRYATRIYPVGTSLYIKEGYEAGGTADILYNNPIINPYRNFLNEIYILKSYPLIQETVEELNFMVSLFSEGNFKTSEIYKPFPLEVKIIDHRDRTIYGKNFGFILLSDKTYQLSIYDQPNSAREYVLNDTVKFDGTRLVVLKRNLISLAPFVGQLYRVEINDPYSITNSYVNRLQTEWAEEGAAIINLDINGRIPQKEIDFLNMLTKKYAERDLENKVKAATRSLEFIEEQLNNISDSLLNYESRLENFKSDNVGDLSSEAQRLLSRLEALESSKAELIIRDNYFKYLNEHITDGQNLDQVILPSSVDVNDPILASLVTRMIDLQLEAKSLTTIENPLVDDIRVNIEDVKKNIRVSVANLQGTDAIALAEIDSKIKETEQRLRSLPGAERKLIAIQRNYSLSENLYVFLAQKRYEAGITKASTTSDIEVVNPAMLMGGAVYPRTRNNYMIAIFIGLGIPLTFFILQQLLNNRIQSKEDLDVLTTIPFIGGVGHNSSDTNLVVYEKPKSGLSESFRSLRSNLNYFTKEKQNKVFLVTSSISGEGKSFTTINLATAIAFSGSSTLIIGADMRKPRLFNDIDLSNEYGLSNYLSRNKSLDDIIQDTFIENLKFISSGPIPPNPSELLMRPEMEQLLTDVKSKFEFIIVDSPPVALVTDAFILSEIVDHTVFVARQNYTPKQTIQSIEDYYRQGKIKSISMFLNDIKSDLSNYSYNYNYGYGYGYGYGYYDDDPPKSKPFFKKLFVR